MRGKIFEYLFICYPIDNPTDPRVDKQFLDYDANGNITHIEREVNNPYMPMDSARESVRKFVWDEEDRLMGVDLRPESSRNQPHISAYTYDAGGERGIRYVPRQMEGEYSGRTAGYTQDMDIMLYPNALITVHPQELPEDFDPMRMHPEHTFTTYTKHYYIGSERINSKLGTVKDLGILCEQMGGNDLIGEMNRRVEEAGERLEDLHTDLDKDLRLNSPYPYSREHQIVCDFKSHDSELYDAYWYHPDHLGSSSFITNTTGEISQHMEYLPFGETLVEEHLNSYNSPFKFNAKEYDAETGNYYYGARYLNPKWSMWLGVDPLAEKYPSISPFAYVANNPINAIDPDGREIVIIGANDEKTIYSQSMNYKGNDKFTVKVINHLNDIYSVEQGQKVLDYMMANNDKFTITNEIIKIENAVGVFPDNSAGTLKLGNSDDIGVNTLSHELFHGYQNMKNQGGTSIKNEVEAYLFGDLIERIYYNSNDTRLGSIFETGKGPNLFDWFDLSRGFTEKPFSKDTFQKLVDDFKENSGANASGLYNNFPLKRKNQTENIYEEFHPIN